MGLPMKQKLLDKTDRHRGGDAQDGKTNKHFVTTDKHRGGREMHQTEKLTNSWLPWTDT